MDYNFDLQFQDKGYGIAYFAQTIEYNGHPVEFIIKDLKPEEHARANTIVCRAWTWIGPNMEQIKDYLSRELAKEFDEKRRKKVRNMPPDDAVMIRSQLERTTVSRVTFFPGQSSFTLDFMGQFNGYQYRMYVTVNDDFTFKRGSILTMGGFKPPKDEAVPDLSQAAILYDYHLRHGNKKNLYKHYAALSAKEIDLFIDQLISDRENDMDERIDLVLYLVLYSHACGERLPGKLYRYLIDREVFYYGELYLRADESVAGELIEILNEVDDAEAYRLAVNHILCALAMIPCKRVNDFLIQSSRAPLPVWAEKLHILPMEYVMAGGWETAEDGVPRMLYDNHITAFVSCEKDEASSSSPLISLSEACGFCGQPLTLVFDDRYKLAGCLHCSCYQTVFTKIEAGGIRWHPANTVGDFFGKYPDYMKNDEDITAAIERGLRLSDEERQAKWTAHQFTEINRTQIGGMPTEVNDVKYPKCPDCGKRMHFAAQLDMADVQNCGEGLYYFFACEDCGVVGTNYDQS